MDWTLVDILLSVIHQASAAGPKFQKWVSAAADELEKQWPQPEEDTAEDPVEADFAPPGDVDSTEDEVEPANGRRI